VIFYLTPQPTTAQRFFLDAEKGISEEFFSSVLSQLKKYQPSGNLKFNNFGIFQSLKFRILWGKNLSNFSQIKFHSKYFEL